MTPDVSFLKIRVDTRALANRHESRCEVQIDSVAGMHRDILRSLYLAVSFCPGSANGVHIVLAGGYRRRREAADRPGLSSRRIVEPDLGARRQTHIDRHGLFADRTWGNRGVITSRVLV